MRFRALIGGLATGTLAAGLVALGSPAMAGEVMPLTIDNQRTGANPIVAGSAQGTTFTITVTNPNAFAVPAEVAGNPTTPGLVLQEVTVKDNRVECMTTGNMFGCATGLPKGIEADAVEEAPDSDPLGPGESLVITAKYAAEAWVPPSTLTLCSAAQSRYLAPPAGPELTPAMPCGITPPEIVSQITNPWSEDSADVDVVSQADLQLTATSAGQTDPGKDATITYTLKDLGPSLATDHKVTFTLPAGLSLVSAGPAPWQCTQTGQTVVCQYPLTGAALEPIAMQFEPLVVALKTPNPNSVAKYDIPAAATSNATDPTPADAKATPEIPMTPVDLAVTKSAGSPVLVDDEATWTVTVKNVGTIADLGKVTVTDTLPDGAKFKSAVADGWTCAADGQKVTCTHTHPELPVGASEDIVIVSKMTERGAPTNKVTVATTSYEKNTADNSAEKTVRVKREEQTAAALPSSPRRILSGTTDQGRKLTTRVLCRPVAASAAGEVSYCKVRKADGVVKVRVFGTKKMKVIVVQTAKGNDRFQPFLQRKTYIVKP